MSKAFDRPLSPPTPAFNCLTCQAPLDLSRIGQWGWRGYCSASCRAKAQQEAKNGTPVCRLCGDELPPVVTVIDYKTREARVVPYDRRTRVCPPMTASDECAEIQEEMEDALTDLEEAAEIRRAVRRCELAECDAEFAWSGAGRPPKYCSTRHRVRDGARRRRSVGNA